jgi:hypothetical protein
MAESMPTFDLHTVVSSVLDSSDLTDPRQIAAAVAGRIHVKDRQAALVAALDPYIRETIQRRRQHNPILGQRVASRSAKVAAIRGWWERAMRDQINTGPRAADWKHLGDCNYDDLMYAATTRWEKAREISAAGDRYAELAKLLNQHAVTAVKALPPEAVQALLFGKVAA